MLPEPVVAIISQYYVYQTIMLYTLNLYSNVCQLFPKKTGGKRMKGETVHNSTLWSFKPLLESMFTGSSVFCNPGQNPALLDNCKSKLLVSLAQVIRLF